MPLFNLLDDNVRKFVPTSVKYTTALLGKNLASDFMHFHRLEPTLATLRWSGKKFLFVHNDIHQQIKAAKNTDSILWQRFPQVYFAFERLLIGQFEQILSCNSESTELYQQHYPAIAERISHIRNTVDSEIFYPLTLAEREEQRRLLAKELKLTAETRFLLFAGRLHPQKDPLLLVRSIAALNEPTAHLLIAGDGELSNEVRAEITQLGLSNRITLLGPINQDRLAELHRLCSAFILTSAYEGLPLVVLETLACGTPVVTTRAGETPRLLSPTSGIVCDERTPQAIAQAIEQVLQHPEQYPPESCVRDTQSYDARSVIHDIYSDMLKYWQPQSFSSVTSEDICQASKKSTY